MPEEIPQNKKPITELTDEELTNCINTIDEAIKKSRQGDKTSLSNEAYNLGIALQIEHMRRMTHELRALYKRLCQE